MCDFIAFTRYCKLISFTFNFDKNEEVFVYQTSYVIVLQGCMAQLG